MALQYWKVDGNWKTVTRCDCSYCEGHEVGGGFDGEIVIAPTRTAAIEQVKDYAAGELYADPTAIMASEFEAVPFEVAPGMVYFIARAMAGGGVVTDGYLMLEEHKVANTGRSGMPAIVGGTIGSGLPRLLRDYEAASAGIPMEKVTYIREEWIAYYRVTGGAYAGDVAVVGLTQAWQLRRAGMTLHENGGGDGTYVNKAVLIVASEGVKVGLLAPRRWYRRPVDNVDALVARALGGSV